MAEGLLRHLAGDLFEVRSAGSKPAGYVHPKAIAVMAELGIDIGEHTSKSLELFLNGSVDVVVTVCGNANDACPIFPGEVTRHHWGFEDPAHAEGSDEEVLEVFRAIRDQIKNTFQAYADGYRDAVSYQSNNQ